MCVSTPAVQWQPEGSPAGTEELLLADWCSTWRAPVTNNIQLAGILGRGDKHAPVILVFTSASLTHLMSDTHPSRTGSGEFV